LLRSVRNDVLRNSASLPSFGQHIESGHEGEFAVLAFFAALMAPLASATPPTPSATEDPPLEAASAWWEKITVTLDDQGKQQSCRYETSAAGSATCEPAMAASIKGGGKGTQGLYKKLTFERRFSPGAASLDAGKLQPGDVLLGRQVMYLTIDATGAIASCKIVSSSGDAPPDYGCDEAKKEQFRAEAAAPAARPAFLTVLAYGHTETLA